MFVAVALLGAGLVLISLAADRFVDHAAALAIALRLSSVLVGAVVIGFGTSAPELLTSGLAARQGDVDVGVGNIVGSNLANITLVLGAAAMMRMIPIDEMTLRREAPLSVVSVLAFALVVRGGMGTLEGLGLLAGLLVFLTVSIRGGMGAVVPDEAPRRPAWIEAVWMVAWLAGTVLGAQLMINGAVRLADELDISGGFVGLTIVALGTSLPELVTAVAAARRGATGLIVGNLLGSNIFNSLGVGAAVALLGEGQPVDGDLTRFPLILMSGVALGVWVMLASGRKVVRLEGIILVLVYLATLPLLPR